MKVNHRLDLIQKIAEWLKYRACKALEYEITREKITISWNENPDVK